jgi:hypothetical protein
MFCITRRQRKSFFFFQIEEDVIGDECVMCRGDDKCVQSFGGETESIQTTL